MFETAVGTKICRLTEKEEVEEDDDEDVRCT